MYQVYNTQEDIASGFRNFFIESNKNIRKTQLNFIPYLLHGIISSKSLNPKNIALSLKDDFSLIQQDSITKRIKRLFDNKLFDGYSLYDNVIKNVLKKYKKKHNDKRVHIIFDHMFSHDNYTVFMITMRIGKQAIPVWFRCFEDKNNPIAFNENTIKDGIYYISNLLGNKYDLIFLADRWFGNINILDYINSLGHTYCIRLKGNVHVTYYDNKKEEYIFTNAANLKHYKYHSIHYKNVNITDNLYKTNIAISNSLNNDEPWIIATNGDVNRAIKDYSYRFGGIETLFKNQKSNCFNLELTVNASLKYFTSMYTFLCIAILFLTILGTEYAKNTKCYKHIKIDTHRYVKGSLRRIMSLFKVGLTLFHLAFNSRTYIRIPFSFILQDI